MELAVAFPAHTVHNNIYIPSFNHIEFIFDIRRYKIWMELNLGSDLFSRVPTLYKTAFQYQ